MEVGIDRVYGAHKRGELLVFDDLAGYLEEKLTYSRVVDEAGNPTEEIDDKNAFHFMDAERYIIGHLKGGVVHFGPAPPPERTIVDEGAAAGVWSRDGDRDEARDGIRWPDHF